MNMNWHGMNWHGMNWHGMNRHGEAGLAGERPSAARLGRDQAGT